MTDKKTKQSVELVFQGIGVSAGVVTGPACVILPESVQIVRRKIDESDVSLEIRRLEQAIIVTRRQILDLQKDMEGSAAVGETGILDAHLMVLDDRALMEGVVDGVRNELTNAEAVLFDEGEKYAAILSSVEDEYLRERVSDVRDVVRRLILNLSGDSVSQQPEMAHRHIIVTRDLAPSQTAALRKDLVAGFVTDLGSPTSHTAVLARALEIPAIVGLHDVSTKVSMGDEALIDGNKGVFIINPTKERLEKYGKVAEVRRNIENSLGDLQHEPAETSDGRRITLSANAESIEEVESVLQHGAEGIGLFRSEYLYMRHGDMPSEDEQAVVYEEVASRLAPAPVIIRTFDVGGDKTVSDAEAFTEPNPFLGCRSIRLSLLYSQHFKAQMRAILRASVHGNVKMMYPMICNVAEVRRANELLEEAKSELVSDGIAFDEKMEVGVMIEVPSAALTAESIAEHVSFLSLGTNDLVQYTLAVDRVNDRVAYLYEPTHPAVLELIKRTIDAAHSKGIWVGLCGEMAADAILTPLLVGMGIDELSVAPSTVPMVKDAIRSVSFVEAEKLAKKCLACGSATDVLEHCRQLTKRIAPELLELI
ncbi:MAG: phosphoenolpyruvate--protein phosphotransferase [Kiritimatiellae bacterium]|nr:phosphoenolpyruvate--protein phosphotransferase [Kiritimatiellia bacterium]